MFNLPTMEKQFITQGFFMGISSKLGHGKANTVQINMWQDRGKT